MRQRQLTVKSREKPVFCVLEPEILYTWDVAEVLVTADTDTFAGLVVERLDAMGTVVLFVQSNMEILFGVILVKLEVVHVNSFVPAEIVAPTSNVVFWAVMRNVENAGS
jgi:hypothetical protein